jgi:predicted permease
MGHVRYAVRSLLKSRGFTAVAVLTIALSIGANTALFSVFNSLVLNPIDLPDAGRLVRIWTNDQARQITAPILSVPKYRAFAEQQTVFSSIAASTVNTAVLTHDGVDPEQLTSLSVTASFVPTLGMPLARGRNFTAEEDRQNGPAVCLITYALWKTRFGMKPDIVGSSIQLDGVSTTVVGVLAGEMPTPISTVQVLTPWPFTPPFLTEQQLAAGAGYLQVTARLKPGVTLDRAKAAIHTIALRYHDAMPGQLDASPENELRTWIEEQVGPVRPTFVMLLAAVGLVLLIACANVSNLFLSRLAARHKEVAVRLSLGATRAQLVRQFLVESGIFCLVAGSLGLVFALWAMRGAERMIVDQLQTPVTLRLDGPMLGVTIALSILSSLMIGLVPALQASTAHLSDVLRENSRGAIGGGRRTRLRSTLIVAEVTLSVVLLVGSSLLLDSFIRLQSAAAGFSTKGIATASVNLTSNRYATKTQRAIFYYQVLDALKSNRQIKDAAVTQALPFSGFNPRGVYAVFGQQIPPLAKRPIAQLAIASEDYFSMLHIPLMRGRLFAPTDIDGTPGICVINESFAKRLFPNENPLGKTLLLGKDAANRMEIVGVIGDVRTIALNAPAPDMIYSPLRQVPGGAAQSIVVSTDGDPSTLQAAVRAAVASVDRSQAISGFTTLDAQVAQSLGVQRVTAWLTGIFAAIALFLSALGLYSVLAYAVTQRRGEIGIRVALGATRTNVVGLVVTQGMRLVAIGLGLGLLAAGLTTRLIASLLFGVGALDPAVFVGVTVLFASVAMAACLVPSWRASRIDALVALRTE